MGGLLRLLLASLCTALCAADFVAVLGRCRSGRCRLLYDSRVSLALVMAGAQQQTLPPTTGGPIVVFVPVGSGVLFELPDGPRFNVSATGRAERVAFVSCNRGVEDADFGWYDRLASVPRDVTLHLGDQVYLDRVARAGAASEAAYDEAISAVYWASWAPIKAALLSSENIMLPDDHDVFNNLDRNVLERLDPAFVASARRAFYRFQFALHADCPTLDCPIYRVESLGHLSAVLLDTRFERTFRGDGSLLGAEQMRFVERALGGAALEGQHVAVVSSVPLLGINSFLCRIAQAWDDEYYPLAPSRPLFASDVRGVLDRLAASNASSRTVIGGDFHHLSISDVSPGGISSIVVSGMTRESTTARSPHGSVLFWAAALFPASIGPFVVSAPRVVCFHRNFLVVNTSAMALEPHCEDLPSRVEWLVRNVRLPHYVAAMVVFVGVIASFVLKARKSGSK